MVLGVVSGTQAKAFPAADLVQHGAVSDRIPTPEYAEAKAQGLDPDRWFNNVELVAAKRIGRETVTYVANIYKYYIAYQLMMEAREEREQAIERLKSERKSGS